MDFSKESIALSKIDADIVVLGVYQDENIAELLKSIDNDVPADFVSEVEAECRREDFTGKSKQTVSIATFAKLKSPRLILRGLGKDKAEDRVSASRKAAAGLARRLSTNTQIKSVSVDLRLKDAASAQAAVEGWILGSYHFHKYKTKKEDLKESTLAKVSLIAAVDEKGFDSAARTGKVIAESTNFARDMIAEPAAYMTPTRLAELASGISGSGISCEILEEAQIEKLGMGAFMGVTRGAHEPAKFIVMRYKNGNAKKTIAIAGKGITFDSGGLSMKNPQGMEHMKYDMSGAAAVLGCLRALAELQPSINIVAVAAATENMPGGSAMHPGDILTAMNGKTIEVNNTDAEGRLVLADALAYLCKEKPDEVLDLATLTGAVVTALGRVAAGIMGSDNDLINRVIKSGADAGEKYWQLPMYDEYKDSLKSDIADLKNAGSRGEAASCSAAMFLKEFVDGKPWAHMDIAGPGWVDKDKDEVNKGGTAFGVRTLCYYVLSEAAK